MPLTWEELRLAAEAGFDELVRQQEEDAEQRAEDPVAARATRHRSPYKSPFRGAPGMQDGLHDEGRSVPRGG